MNHKAKLLDWDAAAAAMKGLQERGETQKMLLVACAA